MHWLQNVLETVAHVCIELYVCHLLFLHEFWQTKWTLKFLITKKKYKKICYNVKLKFSIQWALGMYIYINI